MAFTLEQLRGFVAVADELHFGRAAARLKMTQPPLSRQIQKLERVVGAQLLERDNRRVTLTAAGQVFLVEARRLDRKSTRLNSSHANISYAVFCLKKQNTKIHVSPPSF